MTDLRDLYQEVILDHNRNPRHCHEMGQADCCAQGTNPLCGDQLTLYLKIENDIIIDASFVGKGCAISTASASLMTDNIIGKNKAQAEQLFHAMHTLLTEENSDIDEELLGKLSVFSGVRAYPARVKCATLAWHTLHAALKNQHTPVSTE